MAVLKWDDIHPQVKTLLMSPMNQSTKHDEDLYECGCSQNRIASRDLLVLMCPYHHGYNDALNSTAAFRTIGAGR